MTEKNFLNVPWDPEKEVRLLLSSVRFTLWSVHWVICRKGTNTLLSKMQRPEQKPKQVKRQLKGYLKEVLKMAAEDAGGSGDLAILVNTEMIILKGAVKAA